MSPIKPLPDPIENTAQEKRVSPVPGPGDSYYDGPYLVFTEQYHLRRGWCCKSGCRHCPYGFAKTHAEEV
jgi:hypothetical protein